MKVLCFFLCCLSYFLLQSCSSSRKSLNRKDDTEIKSHVVLKTKVPYRAINTKSISANEVVDFAETLLGIPYKYASADKEKGFDCSGFISYVFNHYKISVPRSSIDFTNAGKEINIKDCLRGDIILFTGSNPTSGVVGHMGIITKNKNKEIQFIHSASGNNKGVMISGMGDYFIGRFVKVIRVFSIFP